MPIQSTHTFYRHNRDSPTDHLYRGLYCSTGQLFGEGDVRGLGVEQLSLCLEPELDPPYFIFYPADSMHQRYPDKNKICNLSLSAAKPGGVGRITWGEPGQTADCNLTKRPLASWQTVPPVQDDRAFQDVQGKKYETQILPDRQGSE